MNVLLFHSVDFPNGAAESAHAALIVRGLRENGEKAYLMIPHGTMIGDAAFNERTHGHVNGVPFFYLNGTTARSREIVKSMLEIYRGMLSGVLLLLRRRLSGKKDVLIIGTPDASRYFPIIIASALLRIPFFVWVVEKSSTDPGAFRVRSGRISYWGFRVSETLLPYLARGYVVISTQLRTFYLKRLPPSKIHISPILVEPDIASDAAVARTVAAFEERYRGKKLVVYSGTFSDKDGIHHLLRAFSMLAVNQNAHLIMTGTSPTPSVMGEVRKTIATLDLTDRVELVGFLSRKDLVAYNQVASVLLVCRTNSEYSRNGFPWKLGEYCMIGRPILATRVGDVERYFEDGKSIFLAEPEDAEAIAQKLNAILDDEAKAILVAKNGMRAANLHFNYIKQTKKLLDFMKKNL